MPLKALLIANGVMVLFVGLCLIQSFNGLNSTDLIARMHQEGLVN